MVMSFDRKATARGIELALAGALLATAAQTAVAEEFPFGQEMTLDARRLAGSKRIPSLEIDDRGATRLELWCKGGSGQFSVAGDTVVFVPGTIESRNCPADKSQLDDALVAALGEATNWKREGDYISFIGSTTLRFHLNTN
jgi:META domain